MIAIRRRLQLGQSDDGLTLIEVIVAMVIFMIVSVGLLYSMMSVLTVNRDSRNRQVAANLAAQEIDLARDINDIFRDDPDPKVYPTFPIRPALNNDTFTVTRTSSWVTSTGAVAPCGTGNGTLRFKLVEVDVTWENMKGDPVHSETYINPNERINDPAKGTLVIAVTTDHGEGVENVQVTADPTTGTTLTGTTDAAGCMFFLGVPPTTSPNKYVVTIASPSGKSYVDLNSNAQPTADATIVAGASTSIPFTYDPSGTIRATYDASTSIVPVNLSTTLLSTRATQISTTTTAAQPRSILISSAYTDGFSVIAGNIETCFANDPTQWLANPTGVPPKLDGDLPDPVAAGDGEITNVTVPMGALTVTGMNGTNKWLVAVSRSTATGGPSCATQQILRFPQATAAAHTYALPFGSWDIYRGNSNSFTPTGTLRLSSGMTTGANGTIVSGVVTFDPRSNG